MELGLGLPWLLREVCLHAGNGKGTIFPDAPCPGKVCRLALVPCLATREMASQLPPVSLRSTVIASKTLTYDCLQIDKSHPIHIRNDNAKKRRKVGSRLVSACSLRWRGRLITAFAT